MQSFCVFSKKNLDFNGNFICLLHMNLHIISLHTQISDEVFQELALFEFLVFEILKSKSYIFLFLCFMLLLYQRGLGLEARTYLTVPFLD
jgi:hypothetical protein